jgi:hypothetical protein
MTSALRPVVIDIGVSLSCRGFDLRPCRDVVQRGHQVVCAGFTAFSGERLSWN